MRSGFGAAVGGQANGVKYRIPLALTSALTLTFAACSDDDDGDTPTGDTSSDVVPGGTALPGNTPSVENTNLANPDAPQDPIGSTPGGSGP
jgi:hypothetical protein